MAAALCLAAIGGGLLPSSPAKARVDSLEGWEARLNALLPDAARLLPRRSHFIDPLPALIPKLPPGVEVRSPKSVTKLEVLFRNRAYDLSGVRNRDAVVPRLYITELPADLTGLDDIKMRKAVFLRSLLPIILMANEEIRALRRRVLDLQQREKSGRGLRAKESDWLDALAARYGVPGFGGPNASLSGAGWNDSSWSQSSWPGSSWPGSSWPGSSWPELLRRLDEIPVSLALAQAIQESGWGRSRFAREGNALFGQRTWKAAILGLVPDRREEGQFHRVRAFPDIMAAARIYMHNLNTHAAYGEFRILRRRMRDETGALDGAALARTLIRYAEEGADYVAALHKIMRANRLSDYDRARLSTGTGSRADEAG